MTRRELFKAVTAGLVVGPFIKPKPRFTTPEPSDEGWTQSWINVCVNGEIRKEPVWIKYPKKQS